MHQGIRSPGAFLLPQATGRLLAARRGGKISRERNGSKKAAEMRSRRKSCVPAPVDFIDKIYALCYVKSI